MITLGVAIKKKVIFILNVGAHICGKDLAELSDKSGLFLSFLILHHTLSYTLTDEISISQNESLPLPTPQLYSEETIKWLFICATMQSEGQFLQPQ